MAFIDYSTFPEISPAKSQTVFVKQAWSDAWVAYPNLVCVESSWRAAPEVNSARFEWMMGSVILPGDSSPTIFGPITARGWYVRVNWVCEDNSTLVWVGFIDASSWPTNDGKQEVVAFGLDHALASTPILDEVWHLADSPTLNRTPKPAKFNLDLGLRWDTPAIPSTEIYAFVSQDGDSTRLRNWSTRDIVRYLLTFHTPSQTPTSPAIPWAIDQVGLLPDWDYPKIDCSNRTLADVLNELISPSQQLGYTVGSDGTTAYLRIFSHLAANVTYAGKTFVANPRQHTLNTLGDPLTYSNLSDVGGGYDQVLVRSAPRISICTLKHGAPLEDAWDATKEESYEEGASLQPGYDDKNTDEKRVANADARKSPFLVDVYTKFKIPDSWDGVIDTEDVFPDRDYRPRVTTLLQNLPIRSGHDWDGAIDPWLFEAYSYRPFFLTFEDPTGVVSRLSVDQIGTRGVAHTEALLGLHDASISAEARWHEFRLLLDNLPNYAVADTTFTALPVDQDVSGLDYTTMEVTIAIEEDRFCEGVWPENASLPTLDIVRRLVVDMGLAYYQVYIVPGTVAGLDETGAHKLSDGGYLRDDSAEVKALAQVIATGAVFSRKRIEWVSTRRISPVAVGDLILVGDGATITAPVTSIDVYAPTGSTRSINGSQTFRTYSGSRDPLALLRSLGRVQ